MSPISPKPKVAKSTVHGDLDFSDRVRLRSRTLRTYLGRRDTAIRIVREAHAALDPSAVGHWLAREANEWFQAPCWVVVAPDLTGRLALLAQRGLLPGFEPSVWRVANWVMEHGKGFNTADLTKDGRSADSVDLKGSILSFPLRCRGRTVAALLALDPAPSASTPAISPAVAAQLDTLLELTALALDNALSFRREQALSITDDLTSLANRRYLDMVLPREAKRAGRTGRRLSVLFIDMDGFKNINDSHDHLAGSKALVEAAGVIRSSARDTDVVSRYGGDEFVLVLPDTDQKGAMAVAGRILERLRAFVFLAGEGLSLRLTCSIGVATLPDTATSSDELLRAADTAMYRVKRESGGDGIHVAERNT